MQSPEEARPFRTSRDEPATPAKKLEAEALELVFAGRFAEALPLLEKAEEIAPGDYSIAANLGTTYELTGDNASALRWIREAVKRNPASHHGTEWVHVLVLEAKLRAAARSLAAGNGPAERLLPVPDRLKEETMIEAGGERRPAREVREAISYQLRERMVFVKPKDVPVADLLFSLAVLNANLVSVESAKDVLALAELYGFSDTESVGRLREAISHALLVSGLRTAAAWAAGIGLLGAALHLAYRKKWFFLSRSAYLAHEARKRAAG